MVRSYMDLVIKPTPEEEEKPHLRLKNLMKASMELMAMLAAVPKEQKNLMHFGYLSLADLQIRRLEEGDVLK
jgi:hypothetical protein